MVGYCHRAVIGEKDPGKLFLKFFINTFGDDGGLALGEFCGELAGEGLAKTETGPGTGVMLMSSGKRP